MKDQPLFPRMDLGAAAPSGEPESNAAPPRLRQPDRSQTFLDPVCLDDRLPADHAARAVWRTLEQLDLTRFYEPLRARGSVPGRSSTDPRLLIALWLYATIDGVGSAREVARLCDCHDAYRWLCGGVSVNYHTLSDFRVEHAAAVDDLLSQLLAVLVHKEVVRPTRISQDGTRVRASAGSGTFRRKESLQKCLVEAKKRVQTLKEHDDGAASARLRAARERAANEHERRVKAALVELEKIEEAKAKQKKKPSKDRPARASATDPDARVMRMPDGGFRPAYNVQLAVDTSSRAIVGVDVTNSGSDANQSTPMRNQVTQRTGVPVEEHLMDGGYVDLKSIEDAEDEGVKVYAPPPKPRTKGSPYERRTTDSDAVAGWRERMGTEEAKEIYKSRGATVETINGDAKTHRGLNSFNVCGIPKVKTIATWFALAYNIMHFGSQLVT